MKDKIEVWQRLDKYKQELFFIEYDIKELNKKKELTRVEIEAREALMRQKQDAVIKVNELAWVLNE